MALALGCSSCNDGTSAASGACAICSNASFSCTSATTSPPFAIDIVARDDTGCDGEGETGQQYRIDCGTPPKLCSGAACIDAPFQNNTFSFGTYQCVGMK
ncbi:MAG: hypothetical protein DYH12_30115 [Sorangiineae bacterium PRO1]|nr:hypothetical protein [Sorangiineae bacterium PRO1]